MTPSALAAVVNAGLTSLLDAISDLNKAALSTAAVWRAQHYMQFITAAAPHGPTYCGCAESEELIASARRLRDGLTTALRAIAEVRAPTAKVCARR